MLARLKQKTLNSVIVNNAINFVEKKIKYYNHIILVHCSEYLENLKKNIKNSLFINIFHNFESQKNGLLLKNKILFEQFTIFLKEKSKNIEFFKLNTNHIIDFYNTKESLAGRPIIKIVTLTASFFVIKVLELIYLRLILPRTVIVPKKKEKNTFKKLIELLKKFFKELEASRKKSLEFFKQKIREIKIIIKRRGKKILFLIFLGSVLIAIFTYSLKSFGYINSDLLDILSYYIEWIIDYLRDCPSRLLEFLKDLLGINSLEQFILNKIKLLEKKNKKYDKLIAGPPSIETMAIFKVLINELKEELEKKLDNLVKIIEELNSKFNTLSKTKFSIQRGILAEKNINEIFEKIKNILEDIKYIREDTETVLSLEHKNLSEKIKKFLENLQKQINFDIDTKTAQISEELLQKLLNILKPANLDNNIIDTTIVE
jgi:DNA-binding transcriptional ArsR family regulator